MVIYQEDHIRLSADISAETLHARREWNSIFKILKSITVSLEYSIQQHYHSVMKKK